MGFLLRKFTVERKKTCTDNRHKPGKVKLLVTVSYYLILIIKIVENPAASF